MSVYDFSDYKAYFNDWVGKQPKQGHGEYRKLALALGVSTTMVSQVFKGDKHLSLELACEFAEYLQLSDAESDFLILLVEQNRAGSAKLARRLLQQIHVLQEKAKKIENRVKKDFELSAESKSIFYSSWIYSGIRMIAAIHEYNDASQIADRLQVPKNHVVKVLDFLIEQGLVEKKSGKLTVGKTSTHIGASNILSEKHHQNWRLFAFAKMNYPDQNNLFYTSPMALSLHAAEAIRAKIMNFIDEARKIAGPSESETAKCLNIDWYGF